MGTPLLAKDTLLHILSLLLHINKRAINKMLKKNKHAGYVGIPFKSRLKSPQFIHRIDKF